MPGTFSGTSRATFVSRVSEGNTLSRGLIISCLIASVWVRADTMEQSPLGHRQEENRHRRRASAALLGYYNFYYTGHPPKRDAARNSLTGLAPQAGFEPATL